MIQISDKNREKIIKIAVIAGIVLCVFGLMDKIFENTVFNLLKNMTRPYLEKSYEESKKLFITLSLLKGTADVIEGSTINISLIFGMDIQLGDLIQPIYDIINIIWQISLASVVILKLETIYYEIFKVKIASILIFISLVTYFPYTFTKNKITTFFKRISKYSFTLLIFIYLLLPGIILINSAISSYFEKEYKEPAVAELTKNLDKLNKVKDELFVLEGAKGIFNIPEQLESAKLKFNNLGKEINSVSQNLIENTPIIIGITLLSYLVLPLLIAVLLYKFGKHVILEKISSNKNNK